MIAVLPASMMPVVVVVIMVMPARATPPTPWAPGPAGSYYNARTKGYRDQNKQYYFLKDLHDFFILNTKSD